FFAYTPATGVYTLSLHDALPIYFSREQYKMKGGFCPFCPGNESKTPTEILAFRPHGAGNGRDSEGWTVRVVPNKFPALGIEGGRSEEHTSELQSLTNLVCRLLLA